MLNKSQEETRDCVEKSTIVAKGLIHAMRSNGPQQQVPQTSQNPFTAEGGDEGTCKYILPVPCIYIKCCKNVGNNLDS